MGFDPVSIGIMLTLAAGGMKAIGSIAGGNAQSNALNYQAKVSDYNALTSARAGEINAENESMKNRAKLGAIKAGYGASGIDVNTGSAADVQAAQVGLGELDALTIKSDAAQRAFGYKTQSELQRAGAKNAKTAGYIDAATSMISAAGSAFGSMPPGDVTAPSSLSTSLPSAQPWEVDFDTSYPSYGPGYP